MHKALDWLTLAAVALSLSDLSTAAIAQNLERPQPKQTFADALALAKPPTVDLYIAVDAAKLKLPDGETPAAQGDDVGQIVADYLRNSVWFGNVTAIAPKYITVVDSPPDAPNPYDGMSTADTIKLLTKTFDATQWKAFMSPVGIGYVDLTSDTQRSIFQAVFPDSGVFIQKVFPREPSGQRQVPGDQVAQARLHLNYRVKIGLPVVGKSASYFMAGVHRPSESEPLYVMVNAPTTSQIVREFGAIIREQVPNYLKTANLDYDATVLKTPVPVENIATVDDLLAAIDVSTHLEIYADARFGRRSVTFVGPAHSPRRAVDLLRALAVCLGGTYREVGPAFVLTNDIEGLGAKHVKWRSFEEAAQAMRTNDETRFNSPQSCHYSVRDIGWDDTGMGWTDAQQKQYWDKWMANGVVGKGDLNLWLPFTQLSPTQQQVATSMEQENGKRHFRVTLEKPILLHAEPLVEVTIPSVDGSISIDDSYDGLLPYPQRTPVPATASQDPVAPAQSTGPEPPPAPAPPLIAESMAKLGRRAISFDITNDTDAAAVIAAARKLNANEIWFTMTPSSDGRDDKDAMSTLAATVRLAHAAGVDVLPRIKLLTWKPSISNQLIDRDILGRKPSEIPPSKYARNQPDSVCPFDPAIVDRLDTVISKASATPGIAGLVLDDIVARGYERLAKNQGEQNPDRELGYTVSGRLAALRAMHVDPIDLYVDGYSELRADLTVPGFDEGPQGPDTLFRNWARIRQQAVDDLLKSIAMKLPSSFTATGSPIIAQPANETYPSTYGSWDDLTQPSPIVQYESRSDPSDPTHTHIVPRLATKCVYESIGLQLPPSMSLNQFTTAVASLFADMAHRDPPANVVLKFDKLEILKALVDSDEAARKGRH